MHLDLRYPIGLLLTTYGAILAFEGAMFRATVLDLNVNLYWGAVMIVCGLGVIVVARRTNQGTRHKAQVTSHKANQKSEITNQK
jgi:hypothetical protein